MKKNIFISGCVRSVVTSSYIVNRAFIMTDMILENHRHLPVEISSDQTFNIVMIMFHQVVNPRLLSWVIIHQKK